jgi:hypothetical protein
MAVRCKRLRRAVGLGCRINVSGLGAVLRATMDTSAPAFSLPARPQVGHSGHRFSQAREDRPSVSSYPLADLGGETECGATSSLVGPVPLFVPSGRSSVPACRRTQRRAQGPSSLAVALTSSLARRSQAGVDGTEHGATLNQVGASSSPVPASYASGAGARPDHFIIEASVDRSGRGICLISSQIVGRDGLCSSASRVAASAVAALSDRTS